MSKTDELVKAVSKKKNNKKESTVKKTIIISVVSTLVVIGLFVATFILGVKWANSQHSEREQIKSAVVTSMSKQ